MKSDEISTSITRLIQIMERLRAPEGCPWDAAQSPESLKPYIIEETYEVLEAIDKGDSGAICDELGDLLLQVVFQAQIFKERGEFDFGDVAEAISDKLVRRHPHVFGDAETSNTEELNAQWNRIKGEEKRRRGERITALGGIPRSLPALMRAHKLTGKFYGATGGREKEPSLALGQLSDRLISFKTALSQETDESIRSRFGLLLLAMVEIGHTLGIDSEETLQQTLTSTVSQMGQRELTPNEGRPSLSDIATSVLNTARLSLSESAAKKD